MKTSELIDARNKKSSKRYVALMLTYFLMLLSAILFLPYEISTNNLELLKIIVGAFALIITTAFAANAAETIKRNKTESNEQQN